ALGLTPGESAPPVQPAPPAYNAPPDRFPPRLAELGYRVTFLNGAEGIQIDIGAAQPDYWNLAQLIHSTVRESLVLRLPRFFGPLQESLRHSEGVPKRVPQFPVELDALFLGLDHRCFRILPQPLQGEHDVVQLLDGGLHWLVPPLHK